MSYASKLKKLNKTFKTAKQRAKEEGGFGSDLPDGRYLTDLEECSLGEAQSSGRLQVGFTFKIKDGEQEGEKIRMYQAVETEDDQVWLERTLKRFGIQIEDLSELEQVVELINDQKPEVKVTLKTKDSGQFTYIDKVVGELDLGDFAAEEAEDEDESEEEEEETDEDGDEDEDTDEEAEDEDEDEDSEDEEEEEAEEQDLSVGMDVGFEGKSGKEITGKVVKILEKEGTVKVKSGDKTYSVKAEDLYIVEKEDEEEEEEEAPVAKKPAAKKLKPAAGKPSKKIKK